MFESFKSTTLQREREKRERAAFHERSLMGGFHEAVDLRRDRLSNTRRRDFLKENIADEVC